MVGAVGLVKHVYVLEPRARMHCKCSGNFQGNFKDQGDKTDIYKPKQRYQATSHIMSCVILTTTLQGRYSYPKFTTVKSEA